ncbi:methyltransferase domain-containing protein, partial [uncultured Thiodictyon sp.]|uniref:methyltransferase domain-containing protein n=1 Tax=uncultured Thiodictyon sp. TaxID=1846217 RepID=UPI0025ED6DBA
FEDYSPSPTSALVHALKDGLFSAIVMSQVLEHAFDVNLWISKANGLLKTGGILAIAVPNFDSFLRYIFGINEPYIIPPAHLNFFSPSSLSRLLERHGFKVERVQHVSRIPRDVFKKRLPAWAAPLVSVPYNATRAVLSGLDQAHMGMIINVYASKRSNSPLSVLPFP